MDPIIILQSRSHLILFLLPFCPVQEVLLMLGPQLAVDGSQRKRISCRITVNSDWIGGGWEHRRSGCICIHMELLPLTRSAPACTCGTPSQTLFRFSGSGVPAPVRQELIGPPGGRSPWTRRYLRGRVGVWMERRARPPQVALPRIPTLQVQKEGLLDRALVVGVPGVSNLRCGCFGPRGPWNEVYPQQTEEERTQVMLGSLMSSRNASGSWNPKLSMFSRTVKHELAIVTKAIRLPGPAAVSGLHSRWIDSTRSDPLMRALAVLLICVSL